MIVPADLSPARRVLLDRLLAGEAALDQDDGIVARAPGRPIPLSPEQEQVWLHAAMAPEIALYNESITIHRRGDFALSRLQSSLDAIIRDHEAWRTGFESGPDGPAQCVHRAVRVPLRLTDLSALAPAEAEAAALRIATQQAREPFDLARPPLLRGHVVRMPHEHRVYLTLHHIIFDGVSIVRIFLPLLAAGAQAAASPALQYPDYALWRTREVQGPAIARKLDEWRQTLAGDLPVLRLPVDHTPPSVPRYRGGMETFTLPSALTECLRERSRQLGVTEFAILLAAFQTLLFRYSGQTDLIVGGVTDMRRRLVLEPMLGNFLNSFPIRTRPGFDMSFAAYARQTGQAVLRALDGSDVPFGLLLQALDLKRDGVSHPLFNVMVSMEPRAPPFPAGWDLTQMDVPSEAAKFDLYLELDEARDGFFGRLVYRRDLFEPATARRIIGHWRRLLEDAAEDPDRTLGALQVLTDRERDEQRSWNDTMAAIPEARLEVLISQRARIVPDHVAIISPAGSVTYRDLDRLAAWIASDLIAAGIVPGSLVAVCAGRGVAMIAGLLGILKAGAAWLPLDPDLPPARLALYVAEVPPDLILVEPSVPIPDLGIARTVLRTQAGHGCEPQPPPCADRDAAAYVLFTSGTTGTPKAVEVTHRAVVNLLVSMQRSPGFDGSDRLLAVTTLAFDIAVLEIFLPLLSGGTVIMAERDDVIDPVRLADLMERTRPTVMQATPSLWRALIDAGWTGSPGLTLLCGGEAMARDLADLLLDRAGTVWNLYGPTEATVWSTLHRVTPGVGAVPIGQPIANTAAHVLDAQGHALPVGVVGDLHLGGAGLARGYRHQPGLTRESFRVQPGSDGQRVYRTGDLARFRDDGTLECLGRTDDQVKVRGHRISLIEIEAALQAHPAVREAAVVVRRGPSGDDRLLAWLVARGDPPAEAELRRFLRATLPDIMVPVRFVVATALPRTSNGKLDRGNLAEPAMDPTPWREAAETPTEMGLAAIFRDLLGISTVGRDDSFFDLGGHSLLAARMVARIERQFATRLSLPLIFQAPTIAGLASRLHRGDAGEEVTPDDRRLMLRFESLGEDCEFGLVQRRHGADPFGLLRFTSIDVEDLVVALRDRFQAIADPAALRVEPRAHDCIVHNDVYRSAYVLPSRSGIDGAPLLRAEAAKLGAVRPMLLRTLQRGSRVCVIKRRAGLGADQVERVQAALRDLGPATLLWVRQSDSRHPPGTVEILGPRLLGGWIDRFAPEDAPEDSSPLWLTLCRHAHRLWPVAARPDG